LQIAEGVSYGHRYLKKIHWMLFLKLGAASSHHLISGGTRAKTGSKSIRK
jgi:hypothetical protein